VRLFVNATWHDASDRADRAQRHRPGIPEPAVRRPLHVANVQWDTKWIVVPIIDLQTPAQGRQVEVIDRGTLRLVAKYRCLGIDTVIPSVFGSHVTGLLAAPSWRTTSPRARSVPPFRAVFRSCGPPLSASPGRRAAPEPPRRRQSPTSPGVPVHRTWSRGQQYAWLGSSAIVWYDEPTKQNRCCEGLSNPGIDVESPGRRWPYSSSRIAPGERSAGSSTPSRVVGSDPNDLDAYGPHILSSFSRWSHG